MPGGSRLKKFMHHERRTLNVAHANHRGIHRGRSHRGQPGDLKRAILDNLYCIQARLPDLATRNDWYMAVAYTVRDRLLQRWIQTLRTLRRHDVRGVGYLSAEFLMGPHLANAIDNLDIRGPMMEAVARLGLDLDEVLKQEEEPGLGNGGLGRLAACFMDSLATLEILPLATVSDTSSGCLTRRFATAGRWRSRTNGCGTESLGDPASGDRVCGQARRPYRGMAR